MLLKNASPDVEKDLISGYKMLTDPQQMGERFKFLALIQHKDEYMPAGFSPI
jgi:SAM-dependent MidA family methyltransferase